MTRVSGDRVFVASGWLEPTVKKHRISATASHRFWQIAALTVAGTIGIAARADAAVLWSDSDSGYSRPVIVAPPRAQRTSRHKGKHVEAAIKESAKPQGPLIIAVSVSKQNVKIYDSNGFFAEAPVSTGMADRPVVRNDFCLVFLHHDGSDGTSYRLRGDQIDIGRTEGDLLFEDPYLSPRHARIVSGPAGQVLSHLESRNGIYIRLRAGARLKDGDLMLVGRQVLLFELVPAFERDLRPAVHHNVVQFGSTGDPSWGRLRQMGPGGVAHDVFYLNREQVVIGREEGDIVFADDHFMSRRHAHISLRGNDPQLEDLGSSNGTFLRLRGPHGLNSGDLIRMGDELLRFEIG